jgi:aspartyl-tRNA(Asn)/glutamyl-tRNA(Gln) amidotransferase subunit C
MADGERIREQGIKLIEKFSEMLKKIPETEETHYVVDQKNVTREDKDPVKKKGFREKLEENAPRWEDGYFSAEKA